MAKQNPAGEKLRECIRPCKLEVDSVAGDWTETTKRWHSISEQCQQAANAMFETWLVWHVQNQSAEKLQEWLDTRKQIHEQADAEKWDKATRKAELDKTPCPVVCKSSECAKAIYNRCTRAFPSLHSTCYALLEKVQMGKFQTDKAKSGSLSKWISVLLHRERFPVFVEAIPIPLHTKSFELIKEGEDYFIEMRITRIPVKGRKSATSVVDKIKLRTSGRKCTAERAMLDKIISNEWPLKGSSLQWDARNRKWMINIAHQRTSKVAAGLNPNKTAYLMPGHKNAFSVFYHDGKKWKRQWFQGKGLHITEGRKRIWGYRAERNANYSHATARKGRGSKNAHRWRARSAQTWKFFVRRVNHAVSIRVAEWCVANGVGKVVYKQPEGRYAESRFVSGEFKNSTWEFYQLGTFLNYKCQERGIECKVEKVTGKQSKDAELQKAG